MSENSYATRYTLIQRAYDLDDAHAWDQLLSHYRAYIFTVLNNMNIDNHDAEDISQEVYIKLANNLKSYDREKGTFRSWLSRVISNTALMHIRKRSRAQKKHERAKDYRHFEELLESQKFEEVAEREWREYITGIGLERIEKAFRGNAFEVFKMDLKGAGAQEIAESLGIEVSTVYTLRKRVKITLNNELASIKADLEI